MTQIRVLCAKCAEPVERRVRWWLSQSPEWCTPPQLVIVHACKTRWDLSATIALISETGPSTDHGIYVRHRLGCEIAYLYGDNSTLWHELAHWYSGDVRAAEWIGCSGSDEEVIAELVAETFQDIYELFEPS